MPGKIRFGMVGTGFIADWVLAGARQDARFEAVAICSRTQERADAFAAKHGIPHTFTSLGQMAASPLVDAVYIATPNFLHASQSILCMRHGKHVLCEKPMAASLEECDAMIAAQRASGKILSIIAQNRFTDAFWRLKQVVDSGELGKVCHAQVDSFWWRGHCYYDLWWRGTWEKEGGGCTLNHAVHHIDAIQWMLGFPTEVVAMMTNVAHDNAEVEDLSAAIFRYSSGALTQLTASVVHHGEDQKIVIQGDKARISAPWDVWASVSADNGFPQEQHDSEREARLDALFRNTPKLKYTLHTGQINDLLNAVEQQGEPLIDGVQGKRSLELITAIYQSSITGRVVTLPVNPQEPWYKTGGLVSLAPHFYEKGASVENFSEVGAIQLGKDLDKGA